jgi:hypothetical protein
MMTYSVGLGPIGESRMKTYSIVRIGNEYIVQVDQKSVLKTASRRTALKTVSCAAKLLQAQSALAASPETNAPSGADLTFAAVCPVSAMRTSNPKLPSKIAC